MAQGAAPPQLQAPLRHWSLRASQAVQLAPFVPHEAVEGVTHWPAWQQPVGQEVESQTQAPPEQRWPTAHWAFPPHLQVPPLQVSARVALQVVQATPPVPQAAVLVLVTQAPLEQQPVAQLVALQPLQAPPVQVWALAAQFWHIAPPVPQAEAAPEVWHWPFESQQPVGQLVGSQTQLPARQCWPVEQSAPAPQPQPPSAPQVSATIGLQLVHSLPASPQLALVGDWQTPPSSQQPLGQLVELHTQVPPMQRWVGLQGGPLPQEQKPPRQVSAKLGSQVWQTSPPLPQLLS